MGGRPAIVAYCATCGGVFQERVTVPKSSEKCPQCRVAGGAITVHSAAVQHASVYYEAGERKSVTCGCVRERATMEASWRSVLCMRPRANVSALDGSTRVRSIKNDGGGARSIALRLPGWSQR